VGNRPFLPKFPVTPGYNIVGDIDVIGAGVTEFAVGDRVAALTVYGGYAEHIYLNPDQLVHVPRDLDKVLLIGASGGVGTAFLDLGKLDNLKKKMGRHSLLCLPRARASPSSQRNIQFSKQHEPMTCSPAAASSGTSSCPHRS